MQEPQGTLQRWSPGGTAWRLGAFVIAYYGLAQVGLLFALPGSLASPIWPPVGLAVACAILWGRRVLPAVFAGAFLVEWVGTHSLGVSLLLASGNTAEAAVGGWLARRAGGRAAFRSLPGVLGFGAAVLVAPVPAAFAGTAGLTWLGQTTGSGAVMTWWTWYLGDAAGAFVVAPVLLLAGQLRPDHWSGRLSAEAAAAATVLAGIAAVVFRIIPFIDPGEVPIIFLLMPPLVWAAFRVGPAVTAWLVMGLDVLAISVTQHGYGPFAALEAGTAYLVLQAFIFTVGLMTLALAGAASERRRAAADLERRVVERTVRLEEVNALLKREADERRIAQQQVAEAQRIAGVGTWRWDITKPHAEWSPELYRIYGLDPATHVPSYADYLTRVHPDDVERVKSATEAVFRDHRPYSHDERVRRPDGSWRHLHTWAKAVLDEQGKLIALVGACQDTTERVVQETKFRDLLESAPDAMLIAGLDGRIAIVNGQAERLFGYSRSELLGQPIDLLVPDALRAGHAGHRADFAADPRARPMGAGLDLRARRKDGTEFPVEVSLSPLDTLEGKFISSAIRDVTQRKEAARALNESLERFRALADASPIGIVHTRSDGIVDYVNERWRQITGVRDHTDREAMRASVHPEDQPIMARLWRACVAEGREFDADMRFVHADGAVRWTRARAVPVRDKAGTITGFVSALGDVTEQRAAEAKDREVQRLREQAEFKTNFLRTAAHELGTPLTPIKIQMRILGDLVKAGGSAPERKAVEILDRNIVRLHVLVKDMLESARLQSGRLKLDARPMDLAHVVHDVVETFQEPAIEGGIVLDTDGPSELPMDADPDRLSQVLYNLLSNAMKFTPAGGHIKVQTTREGDRQVRVTVTDTGAGFAPEQAALLFQPFSQLHDPMERTRSGSGLGLYISRGIVEQHGGSLSCESRGPGLGSIFTFVLPRVASIAGPIATAAIKAVPPSPS